MLQNGSNSKQISIAFPCLIFITSCVSTTTLRSFTSQRHRPNQYLHRAVLLARYKTVLSDQDGLKGKYRVDDIPADDWVNATKFYDVLVFNTAHWWGYDKFPKETPLIFYKAGQPVYPPLGISDGLKVVPRI